MKNRRLISFIVITLLLVLLVVKLPIITVLGFYDDQSDEMIAYRPLKAEDTFQIVFVHSIHLTDVTEKYQITAEGEIKQYEMIFSQFGIGMPSEVADHESIEYKDGFYHLTQMNNIFNTLHIRNGKTVSEHRFRWQPQGEELHEVFINDYMEPGETFILKAVKMTLLDMWKEVKIHE